MRDYKVNYSRGIRKWASWTNQFNEYIPYMPSKTLDKKREDKGQFTKIDTCEIFDGALPKSYLNKLFGQERNIYEENIYKENSKNQ